MKDSYCGRGRLSLIAMQQLCLWLGSRRGKGQSVDETPQVEVVVISYLQRVRVSNFVKNIKYKYYFLLFTSIIWAGLGLGYEPNIMDQGGNKKGRLQELPK